MDGSPIGVGDDIVVGVGDDVVGRSFALLFLLSFPLPIFVITAPFFVIPFTLFRHSFYPFLVILAKAGIHSNKGGGG